MKKWCITVGLKIGTYTSRKCKAQSDFVYISIGKYLTQQRKLRVWLKVSSFTSCSACKWCLMTLVGFFPQCFDKLNEIENENLIYKVGTQYIRLLNYDATEEVSWRSTRSQICLTL